MELSIIIPVYNTDYQILKQCLESIIKKDQNFLYEIIIIDDGSNSINSLKYKELIWDSKIKYIYQENKGVSSARNLGISRAKGKYIMFVDSDDYIYSDCLDSKIFYLDSDIIVFDKNVINKNKIEKNKEFNCNSQYISVENAIEEFVIRNKLHSPFAKIIRTQYVIDNNIKFNTNFIQGEDALFNLELLQYGPRIFYTDKVIYGYKFDYRTYNNRLLKFPQKVIENSEALYNKKIELIQKNDFTDKENKKVMLNINYFNAMFSYSLVLCSNGYKKYIDYLKKIVKFSENLKINNSNMAIRLKKILIKNESWILISMLGKIRNIYMNYIKNNYKF